MQMSLSRPTRRRGSRLSESEGRKNVLAARRSRGRKLEYQRELEECCKFDGGEGCVADEGVDVEADTAESWHTVHRVPRLKTVLFSLGALLKVDPLPLSSVHHLQDNHDHFDLLPVPLSFLSRRVILSFKGMDHKGSLS